MRPKTIVYFEWIIFGTLLLGVSQSYLDWDRAMAIGPPVDPSLKAAFILSIGILTFVVIATLTLLVSRRRSKIAMWVFIALFAFPCSVHDNP